MGYMRGIDVSKWQQNKLDYVAAKNAGYEFVFIRIGYNTSKDAYFESNYIKAKAAGMKIGVYFYTTQTTVTEARNDANRVLVWLGSKTLDMPIAYDMEETSMKKLNRKDLNSKQYNAFAEVVKEKGFVSMLYTGASMFNSYFNKTLITDPLWIAKYSANDGFNHGCPNVGKQIAIHQYTSAAIPADFYSGNLDRNQMMISYDELMKKTTTSTTPAPSVSSDAYTKKQCVKDIQKTLGGLTVDGICGVKALAKLPTISKKTNNRHAIVKYVQKYLNAQNYNCGVEDGICGAKFDAAVKAFQKANGLEVDGIIGKNSWKKLLG